MSMIINTVNNVHVVTPLWHLCHITFLHCLDVKPLSFTQSLNKLIFPFWQQIPAVTAVTKWLFPPPSDNKSLPYYELAYHGPCCNTAVTAATKWVAPPTLEAAVKSSFIWIRACLRVLPLFHLVWAADKKSWLDICTKTKYFLFEIEYLIHRSFNLPFFNPFTLNYLQLLP